MFQITSAVLFFLASAALEIDVLVAFVVSVLIACLPLKEI